MTISDKPIRPSLSFLLAHPSHFLGLGFGAGLSPIAPGTIGTLVAFPLFFALSGLSLRAMMFILIVAFIVGVFICQKAGDDLGVPDHGSIVWDEIVAMMLVLVFAPNNPMGWLTALVGFRFFDILKPFPIRFFDQKLKGGFGVMFDDLLAAIYTLILMKVVFTWILN
jgi:phosphatidylglycerophosphatase A